MAITRSSTKRNSTLIYLVVLIVVALLGLVGLFFNESNNVGAVIYDREKSGKFHAECFDIDKDNNINVKGLVYHENYVYRDLCGKDNVHLYQVYCASSQRVGTTFKYPCPNGCKEGVCL